MVALALSPFGYALPAIPGSCDHSEGMSMHEMHELMVDMSTHDMATDHWVADTDQDRCCCCDGDCGHATCGGASACGAHVSAALHELMAQIQDHSPSYPIQLYSPPHLKVPLHALFKPPRLQHI